MEDRLYKDVMEQLLKKDLNTYEHSVRVGKLCAAMAAPLQLDEKQAEWLLLGGCLHDVGKMLVPKYILTKKSALSPHEWKIMQQHTYLGAQTLHDYEVEPEIVDIIHFHHERLNGKGYPLGLSGRDIPALAQICGIVDSFDSMVSDRPYRKGMPFQDAEEELLLHSGTQFDSEYVQMFLTLSPTYGGVYDGQTVLCQEAKHD
ncbi:HD domain-containing phosphohydrolase [Paenibacillus oryzisoli]|uniref:HD-GYP domain-containing protein n=1 Tax=Paenibacillus oryzisoli TaxID=1850517 RepID=UPI003D2C6E6B